MSELQKNSQKSIRDELNIAYVNKDYSTFEKITKEKLHWPVNMFYPISENDNNYSDSDIMFLKIILKNDDKCDNFLDYVFSYNTSVEKNVKFLKTIFQILKDLNKLDDFVSILKELSKDGPIDSADEENEFYTIKKLITYTQI